MAARRVTHFEQRTEDTLDNWRTPQWVLDLVRKVSVQIALDPCTEDSNPTNALEYYAEGGLEESWFIDQVPGCVWVNPPYGRALSKWADKCVRENSSRDMFVLTPSRTEANWFGSLWDNANACAFFRKRIKFEHPSKPNAQSPAFPNALFYFGGNTEAFSKVFLPVARIVRLK